MRSWIFPALCTLGKGVKWSLQNGKMNVNEDNCQNFFLLTVGGKISRKPQWHADIQEWLCKVREGQVVQWLTLLTHSKKVLS